ncbi:expressed unknown protein [Seminavis robusta]|uniref:Uncharacterized protein n=1 Tax=Seminavis robusta TaxID=568900 RepID=A0A9N8HB26_9STRA|nr:expressed unknown protein [Seminavis robusta]|eukprot:Sro263_g102190.1 n/a (454) ;mRNA; r:17665-19026
MSQSNSRKRKARNNGSSSQSDLPQDESTRDNKAVEEDNKGNHYPHGILKGNQSSLDSTSLEYLLAVPLEIIFRQIPTDNAVPSRADHPNGKPLLTRAEARCMLQILSWSQEWDVLFQASTDSLKHRAWSRQFQLKLLTSSSHPKATSCTQSNKSHPYLRPLVPLLEVEGQYQTTRTLQLLDEEMHTVLTQLQLGSQALQQFAEHNWTLSENLLDALGANEEDYFNSQQPTQNDTAIPKGALLAREKRRLAELQEEICQRIGVLVRNVLSEEEQEENHTGETKEKPIGIESYDTSMATVCAQLWKLPELAITSMNNVEVATATNQQEQQHQRSSKVGVFDYAEPMQEDGKEQTPEMHDRSIQQQPQQNEDKRAAHNLSDDDDETVMDEQGMLGGAQHQQQESQHSIVSNNSADQGDQPKHQQVPTHVVRKLTTESQIQKFDAGEALVMFACQES